MTQQMRDWHYINAIMRTHRDADEMNSDKHLAITGWSQLQVPATYISGNLAVGGQDDRRHPDPDHKWPRSGHQRPVAHAAV